MAGSVTRGAGGKVFRPTNRGVQLSADGVGGIDDIRARGVPTVAGRPMGSLQADIARRNAPYSLRDVMPLSAYLTGHNPRTDGTMNVTDATNAGQTVMPWAPSSGAGPGSRGYQGSGHSYGYSFDNQGTADDFIRQNGGMSAPRPSLLNDLYLNQPGVTQGAFDRLQSQKAMDEADPIASFYQNKSAVSGGAGNFDQAGFWQRMLQDQLAQRQSSVGAPVGNTVGSGGEVGAPDGTPEYHAPGETRFDAGGNQWRWNEASGHGDLIKRAPTFADVLAMREAAAADSGIQSREFSYPNVMDSPPTGLPTSMAPTSGNLVTDYGTASMTNTPEETTFTNGQGSALSPGVQFTGRTGTQSAVDFFRDAANRQGANRFAQPEPGFQGVPVTQGSPSWRAYEAAMRSKKALGKK